MTDQIKASQWMLRALTENHLQVDNILFEKLLKYHTQAIHHFGNWQKYEAKNILLENLYPDYISTIKAAHDQLVEHDFEVEQFNTNPE